MSRTTLDLWVGIFVAAGIAALVLLALKVSNASTSFRADKEYTVSAEFQNIGSLKVGAPVRSSGVMVGRVESVRFDTAKYVARIVLKIDERYPFPKDTTAAVLTSGLLGEQYVGLEAGGDDTRLEDGDMIRLTQSAVVLEKLIGQVLFDKAQDTGSGNKQ
jgi:phospholipid/cholesterol/gamma-HCH transport system substrate-binding protein